MRNWNRLSTSPDDAAALCEVSRSDRIVLHLRCLWHDHKYRWHFAGVWRELRCALYQVAKAAVSVMTLVLAIRTVAYCP
jgi:hypothetical protein